MKYLINRVRDCLWSDSSSKADNMLRFFIGLYILTFVLQYFVHAPWYEAVLWVTQSALIGSIADWFAVTALFRHPFGNWWGLKHLFREHVRILPKQKERISESVQRLMSEELLPSDAFQKFFYKHPLVDFLNVYLQRPDYQVARRQALSILLETIIRDKELVIRAKIINESKQILRKISLSEKAQVFIVDELDHDRKENVIDYFLDFLDEKIRSDEFLISLEEYLEMRIERESSGFFSQVALFLANLTDVVNVPEMAETVQDVLLSTIEVWSDKEYIGRQELVNAFKENLSNDWDRSFKPTIDDYYVQTVEKFPYELVWSEYVWPRVLPHILVDDTGVSKLGELTEKTLVLLWATISKNNELRMKLDHTLTQFITRLISDHHEVLGKTVSKVLAQYDDDKLNKLIKKSFGEDLDSIRITGALVGGVLGLVVWGITQLLDMFLLY